LSRESRLLRILLCGLLAALPLSGMARSCPAGIPAAGNPMCLPPSARGSPYYRAPAAPAGPRYVDRWGAVAYDRTVAGAAVSFSSDMRSERLARKEALKRCKAAGGEKCVVKQVFRNGCGVVVWGLTIMEFAVGPTLEETTRSATEGCARDSEDCRVYAYACSPPLLVD
jgi:hypothetical protein